MNGNEVIGLVRRMNARLAAARENIDTLLALSSEDSFPDNWRGAMDALLFCAEEDIGLAMLHFQKLCEALDELIPLAMLDLPIVRANS